MNEALEIVINKIGKEDLLLFNKGDAINETQIRNGENVQVTRIKASDLMYDENNSLVDVLSNILNFAILDITHISSILIVKTNTIKDLTNIKLVEIIDVSANTSIWTGDIELSKDNISIHNLTMNKYKLYSLVINANGIYITSLFTFNDLFTTKIIMSL